MWAHFRIWLSVGVLFLWATALTFSSSTENASSSGTPDSRKGCSTPPLIDPMKDFVGNFNNTCYAQALASSNPNGGNSGDTNAIYEQVFYQVIPGYELVIIATFPNARFQSIEVYDSHTLRAGSLADYQILPLTTSMVNPYQPGVQWVPNQQWGATVGFGSPPPTNVAPGCSTSDTTIDSNFIDASQIHMGITWTGYPKLPKNFPTHQTGANTGGNVMVRRYQDISSNPATVVIVRQLSDGCAVPLTTAVQNGIISVKEGVGSTYLNPAQYNAHNTFASSILPVDCYPPDPLNGVMWMRGPNFVEGGDDYGAYLKWAIPPKFITSLSSGGQFIRMLFPSASVPSIPCAGSGCTLTGNEQLRYFSFSFVNAGSTLLSVKDTGMVRDPNGNIALIFGVGNQPPAYVTAANYYTYIDLTQIPNFASATTVNLRSILPSAAFQCSTSNVPYLTSEYNPEGGFMGQYVPTVDFPTAAQIPMYPVPVARPDSCAVIPTQTPSVCGGNH